MNQEASSLKLSRKAKNLGRGSSRDIENGEGVSRLIELLYD